jgi:hypothetical protein
MKFPKAVLCRYSVTVDGQQLPLPILEDAIQITSEVKGKGVLLTVTFLVESVQFDPRSDPKEPAAKAARKWQPGDPIPEYCPAYTDPICTGKCNLDMCDGRILDPHCFQT